LGKVGRAVHNGVVIGVDVKHENVHAAFYGATPRTNATRAAISRAMLRLSERGLLTLMCAERSNWAGANLTEAGEAVARAALTTPITPMMEGPSP
jgi:hypothetical protein